MGYYRVAAKEAWSETLGFARRYGIWVGPVAGVLGGFILWLITRELDWRPFALVVAGPVTLLLLDFLVNFVRTPPRLAARQQGAAAELRAGIERLESEKQALLDELTPHIEFESGNSPEYDRELEVEVVDHSTHVNERERTPVKLLKVTNLSAQSLVVNAAIEEVDPPIVQDGPPIMLKWKGGFLGNNTLPAHGHDYLVLSPPFPDVELWASTYTRTIKVSAWVGGHLGRTGRYRLSHLHLPNHQWIETLPD